MMPKHNPKISSFIDSVRPEKQAMPLEELTERFNESRRAGAGFMPFGNSHHGINHLAELRIREWMLRTKPSEDDIAIKNDITKNGNKISPPGI